jgi:hypothetical protein
MQVAFVVFARLFDVFYIHGNVWDKVRKVSGCR